MSDKKKKHKNLDDFFEDFRAASHKDLEKSFEAVDKFTGSENVNHYINNIFAPAQNDLYKTASDELDKIFKDDTKKLKGKDDDVKKAVSKGLKSYFKIVQPSIVKTLESLNLNEEDTYKQLVKEYDDHIGAGQKDHSTGETINSLGSVIEAHLADENKSVGDLKTHLYLSGAKDAQNAINQTQFKVIQDYYSKYHRLEVASYVKGKLKKHGYKINDPSKFVNLQIHDLHNILSRAKKKQGMDNESGVAHMSEEDYQNAA